MDDPNFFRSVVYLVEHGEKSSFGLILNRPTDFCLEKVVSMVSEVKCVHEGPLYCGGPVDGPLMALHDQPALSNQECIDGLYMTSDQDNLLKLFVMPEAKLKLFDGFAGWGEGQLDEELKTGSWLVVDVDADIVFSDDPDLWENLLKRIGQNILSVDEKISDSPVNPEWN